LPDDGLDINRTGSIHSLVGPAEIKKFNFLAIINVSDFVEYSCFK